MLKPHHLDLEEDFPCPRCEEAEADLTEAWEAEASVEATPYIGTCPECGRHGRQFSIDYSDTGISFFILVTS